MTAKKSLRWLDLSVVLLLLLIILTPNLVAATVPCYCNNGNIDIASPQCVCACFSGYLMPHCLYTADDTVRMQLYTQINPNFFSADALEQEMIWSLPISNPDNIAFAWATPLPLYNWTVAYFDMKGNYAQQLLWDFYSNNSWLLEAQIRSVWEDIPAGAPMDVPLSKGVIYRDTKGNVVSVDQLSWLFGAVCVVVVISLLECCCFSNKETDEDEDGEEASTPHPAAEDIRASRASVGRVGASNNPLASTPQQQYRTGSAASRPSTSAADGGQTPQAKQRAMAMEATPSKQHQVQSDFCSRSRM